MFCLRIPGLFYPLVLTVPNNSIVCLIWTVFFDRITISIPFKYFKGNFDK